VLLERIRYFAIPTLSEILSILSEISPKFEILHSEISYPPFLLGDYHPTAGLEIPDPAQFSDPQVMNTGSNQETSLAGPHNSDVHREPYTFFAVLSRKIIISKYVEKIS
jgi:hypothetical protein